MITVNSRRGLRGLGDLGLVMPTNQMAGATEDTLILGLGRKMQRHSVLLGAVANTTVPAGAIAPRTFAPRTSYIAPSYSPMPVAPQPIPDTRVPSPLTKTVTMNPPRLVSPSGASATWTQTSVAPTPMPPPVTRPSIPLRPAVQPSPMDYPAEAGTSAANPGDWNYYGSDPYATRPPADAAGAQTAAVGNQAPSTGAGQEIVAQNGDGSLTQQNGDKIDPATGEKVGTDYWQWVKDNKGAIGIGAAVLVGAVVLFKVIR